MYCPKNVSVLTYEVIFTCGFLYERANVLLPMCLNVNTHPFLAKEPGVSTQIYKREKSAALKVFNRDSFEPSI